MCVHTWFNFPTSDSGKNQPNKTELDNSPISYKRCRGRKGQNFMTVYDWWCCPLLWINMTHRAKESLAMVLPQKPSCNSWHRPFARHWTSWALVVVLWIFIREVSQRVGRVAVLLSSPGYEVASDGLWTSAGATSMCTTAGYIYHYSYDHSNNQSHNICITTATTWKQSIPTKLTTQGPPL